MLRVKNMHSFSTSYSKSPRGKAKPSNVHYIIRQGKAKPMYIKTSFSVSLPPQCDLAVVYVSTTRMYPQRGYFLLINIMEVLSKDFFQMGVRVNNLSQSSETWPVKKVNFVLT